MHSVRVTTFVPARGCIPPRPLSISRITASLSQLQFTLPRSAEAKHSSAADSGLDQAKTTIAERDKELKDIRQILNKTAEAEKGGRQLIEAFDRQVTQLQAAIAAYEEKLARTIPADGLGDQALAALGIFRARLARGEGIREAALGTAGYNPLDVEAAMGKQDRDEMRAFEALLARSSWRRRLVLRLLGATNK
jgi:hypothetical protein